MKTFLLNIILALVWGAFSGSFTFTNFALGFLFGYFVLWMVQPMMEPSNYFKKFTSILGLFFHFLYELVHSSTKVAFDALTPKLHARPGVIGVPIGFRTDWEIVLLANLISLTPGTLTLDISEDKKIMYIHVLYINDIEEERIKIKNGMERRLMKILR